MSMESFNRKKPEAPPAFSDPDIERPLQEVHFEGLKKIFKRYAVASGIEPSGLRLVEPSEIKNSSVSRIAVGGFNMRNGEISLSEKGMQTAFKLDSEHDKTAKVLSIFIHEQTHAFGGSGTSEHTEDTLAGLVRSSWESHRTGFSEVSIPSHKLLDSKETFRWFNEGFVDEMASEVYEEYVRQEGVAPSSPEKDMGYADMYPLARLFVRSLRERIAEESGVPGDIVWHSLIKAYAEGNDLQDGEIRNALEEVFSPKFIDRLAGISASYTNPIKAGAVFSEVLSADRVKKIISTLKKT